MQTVVKAKKPRNQAISGRFWAGHTYRGRIKDDHKIDPVCGSGHCHIIPYWADVLGKEALVAYQASKRGGTLYCRREGNKIYMAGKAALYSIGDYPNNCVNLLSGVK